jgi:hypothetical protein
VKRTDFGVSSIWSARKLACLAVFETLFFDRMVHEREGGLGIEKTARANEDDGV